MKYKNKSVLVIIMKWDYGIEERGRSNDQVTFGKALEQLCGTVDYLWFDEYFNDTRRLQAEIMLKVEKKKYDLLFFLMFKDDFTIETLDHLKMKTVTVGFFGDDQWRFENYSSKYAPHFTYICTTDPWSIQKYRKIGITPIISQWAGVQVCPEKTGPLDADEKYEYDVSFVGQNNPYREWFAKILFKQGITVESFGPGWKNGRLSSESMEQLFRNSKINLNISNSVCHDLRFVFNNIRTLKNYLMSPKRVEQPKARNFEIPLAGGFQLANYFLGLEKYFLIGEEIALYNTPEECARQIHYYLEAEGERRKIMIKGYERALHEHMYFHRMEKMLEQIWQKVS